MDKLRRERNASALLSVILLISNLLLVFCLFKQEPQIILVPPELTREVSLSKNQLSSHYLEEMSGFFLSKLLDLTPETLPYQSEIILRHVHPSFHHQMQEFFKSESSKYREFKLTTYFVPDELKVDTDNLSVTATGTLYSAFGGNGSNKEIVTYRIDYDYRAGRLTIVNFSLKEKEDE